jgi:GT2 family glycosyltransferase
VLNADVRLGVGCVGELLRALEVPGTGIVVPRLIDREGRLIESMRREPTILRALGPALMGARRAGHYPSLGEVVTERSAYETETVTDWAEGSTQLISSACWSVCGPWDESFFLYSEETEFDLRSRDHGFATRYVPTATATHLEGGSATSSALWPLLVVNRIRLFRRRNSLVKTSGFWCANLLRESSRAVLGRAPARAAARALLSPARLSESPGPDWIR